MKTVFKLIEANGLTLHGDIEHFVDLIRADEREACAKVCDEQIKVFLSSQYKTGQPLSSFWERHAAASCAEFIRARGNK